MKERRMIVWNGKQKQKTKPKSAVLSVSSAFYAVSRRWALGVIRFNCVQRGSSSRYPCVSYTNDDRIDQQAQEFSLIENAAQEELPNYYFPLVLYLIIVDSC